MRDLTELAVTIAIWALFALAALCIFLIVFFAADVVLNGFVTVESCEVTK